MRASIPPDVAALLEQLDRRIEESRALRAQLQAKTAERRDAEQMEPAVHEARRPDTSGKT